MPKRQGTRAFIPAAGHAWLTPLYDPLQRWLMREPTIKGRLVEQAGIENRQRVLDLGCGTGTLALQIKRHYPGALVVGLDVDLRVLALARAKVLRAGVLIALTRGSATDLPYPEGAFDRVVSSLVLHHLTTEDKRRALAEAYRVLRPGGELHIADFGRPHNAYTSAVSLLVRHFEQAAANVAGALPDMMRAAGFEQVRAPMHYTTTFGSVSLYQGCKGAHSEPPEP
jgi:ubiquinone/menaquinone biosynthesis C-methylase UbiE